MRGSSGQLISPSTCTSALLNNNFQRKAFHHVTVSRLVIVTRISCLLMFTYAVEASTNLRSFTVPRGGPY